jgi:hypothetical protein
MATTFGLLAACGGEDDPAAGDGDGDTVAPGDGDGTTTGDGDMMTAGDGDDTTSTGGTTATSTGGTTSTSTGGTTTVVDLKGETCATPAPLNDHFQPTGWMGDDTAIGIDGEGDPCEERSSEGAVGDCYKVTLGDGTGAQGWAGVFWQHPNNNWGDAPGCDFSDGPTVSFMAKGAVGGEAVGFSANGMPMAPDVTLTDQWVEYTIDLSQSSEADNIWGALSFSATTETTQTFYIDDIYIGDRSGGMGGASAN